MTVKAGVAIVKGDMVRQVGAVSAYRRVLGVARDAQRTRLWLEDPERPGSVLGAPLEVITGGVVDTQPPSAAEST